LGERAKALIEVGETMKRQSKEVSGVMEKRSFNKSLRDFEKQYYYIKQDYKILDMAYKLKKRRRQPFNSDF